MIDEDLFNSIGWKLIPCPSCGKPCFNYDLKWPHGYVGCMNCEKTYYANATHLQFVIEP